MIIQESRAHLCNLFYRLHKLQDTKQRSYTTGSSKAQKAFTLLVASLVLMVTFTTSALAFKEGAGSANCNDSNSGDTTGTNADFSIMSGALMVDHTLQCHRSLNQRRTLKLQYSSLRANPQPIARTLVFLGYSNKFAKRVTSTASIGSNIVGPLHWDTTDIATSNGGNRKAALILMQFDGSNLETGQHTVSFNLTLDGVAFKQAKTAILIHNEKSSPYGAGWTLDGVSRIKKQFGNLLVIGGSFVAAFKPTSDPKVFKGPPGNFSSIRKLDNGSYIQRLKDGTRINFSATGLQTSIVDRNGNQTTFAYDTNGRLSSITDPVGLATKLSYNTNGMLDNIMDAVGRITTFRHDNAGNLARIIDPDGSFKTYRYDAHHQLVSETTKRNITTTYQYNFAGRAGTAFLPGDDGTTRSLAPAQTFGLVDPSSGKGTSLNPAPAIRQNEVKAIFTDANGNQTTYLSFDKQGLGTGTKVMDALGRIKTTETNSAGLPTRIVQENGAETKFTYDNRGNVLTQTKVNINAITQFTYESMFNKITSITDPKGNVTSFTYDDQGNLLNTMDPLGNETSNTYNSRGLLATKTDALGNKTTFDYNDYGNLTKITDPLGDFTEQRYDVAGNIEEKIDAEGRTTGFMYDLMNRLVEVIEPTDGVTRYSYDLEGNLVKIRSANNRDTHFLYDTRERLIKTIYPDGLFESGTYDGEGNIVTKKDRSGRNFTFEYDPLNRLSKKILPKGEVTTFEYDEIGNLIVVQDPDSRVSQTFDKFGRMISTSTAGSLKQPNITIKYTYDKNDNRISMEVPSSGVTSYTYSDVNRITSITNPEGQTIGFSYDTLNRGMQITRPSGVSTIFTYDEIGNVKNVVHKKQGTILSSFEYTYNAARNRTALYTMRKGLSVKNNLIYSYDVLDRLTHATRPLPGQLDETFHYDKMGNRIEHDGQPAKFNKSNNRLIEDQKYRYKYDRQGNIIKKINIHSGALTRYWYDAENQLVDIRLPDGSGIWYKYDGLGRRILKNVSGTITRYIYDKDDILLEFNRNKMLLARYTHGAGVDEPLIMNRDLNENNTFESSERFYYHTDALGSITDLTNHNGFIQQSYAYDSFGEVAKQVGAITNPYIFTGREFDSETGLYYYRARYYDPYTGRFVSEDPIKGTLEEPRTHNLYPYVMNNPVNIIDPTGALGEGAKAGIRFGSGLVGGAFGGLIGGIGGAVVGGFCGLILGEVIIGVIETVEREDSIFIDSDEDDTSINSVPTVIP